MLRKRDMLVGEGVQFDPDGRVAKVSLHVFGVPAAISATDTGTSSAKSKSRNAGTSADGRQSKRAKTKSSR